MTRIQKILLGVPLFFMTATAYAGHWNYYGGGSGSGSKVTFLLLALAAGYWVLTLSDKQKRPLDVVGRIVGALIILVTLGGLVCTAVFGWCKWKGCFYGGASKCPYHSTQQTPTPDPSE